MKQPLSQGAIFLMHHLMTDETICNKVKSAAEKGKSYAVYTICDDGMVILGETKYPFWNQLIGCRFKLTFESWALAVWDALVDLSAGSNATAIEKGLSTEIAQKAQRIEDYEWVVKRLYDCYEHVCNDKPGNGAFSAGNQGEKGSSASHHTVMCNNEPVTININANNLHKTLRFPDATGRASLNFDLGVVGVRIDRD